MIRAKMVTWNRSGEGRLSLVSLFQANCFSLLA